LGTGLFQPDIASLNSRGQRCLVSSIEAAAIGRCMPMTFICSGGDDGYTESCKVMTVLPFEAFVASLLFSNKVQTKVIQIFQTHFI